MRTGDGHDELRLSFAELDARVNRLAHALAALGIGEGDHVGCHLYDGNQYVEATLAAYKLRAVPVNVNFRYVDEELTYLFDNADLKVVFTEPDLEDRAARAAATLAWPCPIVVADERYETPARRPARHQARRRRPLTRRSVRALDRRDDRHAQRRDVAPGRHLPFGHRRRRERGARHRAGRGPRRTLPRVHAQGTPLPGTLTLCPLMHGGGFWLAFSAILSGSFSVLIRDIGFDPAFALRVIGEERVSLVMTIGDAYARPIVDLLEKCGPDDYDLSSLLVYGSGGAILSPSVKDDLGRLLPRTFVHDGFGASETGGQGRLIGTGADGAPRFDMEAGNVVIADDGTLCQPGDGRIGMLANSGQIPLGYYKDEAKTAATFPVIDGVRYAVPGDLASVDADGSIAVYGRGSVSINSGGEKIFPEEVEKALKRHPAVFDATVVGTPNERFGSQVTAVVELRSEHADDPPELSELQEHCRQHLAGYKVPRAVVFVDDTVRSPSGKPDYRWAKETALAGLVQAADGN